MSDMHNTGLEKLLILRSFIMNLESIPIEVFFHVTEIGSCTVLLLDDCRRKHKFSIHKLLII